MAPETSADLGAPRTRLALLLLMAPALVWLVGLIVLPHLDLAVLSLRTRVAPRVYEFSFNQYRTFVDEPLYWHTFVRTAAMSILATACTLLSRSRRPGTSPSSRAAGRSRCCSSFA